MKFFLQTLQNTEHHPGGDRRDYSALTDLDNLYDVVIIVYQGECIGPTMSFLKVESLSKKNDFKSSYDQLVPDYCKVIKMEVNLRSGRTNVIINVEIALDFMYVKLRLISPIMEFALRSFSEM